MLICVLAYYVEWHLRRAWRGLLFADEELDRDRQERDPVAPAQPSASVRRKKSTHQTAAGLPVHSFRTLLAHMGGRRRETCQVVVGPERDDVRTVERPRSGPGGGTAALGNVAKIET